MKQLQFGEWVIEVDVEATKQYYHNLQITPSDDQCYRNYCEYCKTLSPAEQQFFDSLCITPEICKPSTIGLDKNGCYFTSGHYFIIGKYIQKRKLVLMTYEEFADKGFKADSPDPRSFIGRYMFDFQDPESPFSELPENMPNDSVCIRFFLESPWLLKERCKSKQYYPPKKTQYIKRLIEYIKAKKSARKYKSDIRSSLKKMFAENSIAYKKMSKKQTEQYMQDWFSHFVPKKKQQARANCFPTKKYFAYLWHTFGYTYTPCIEEEGASTKYDEQKHKRCVLLMNYDKLAYTIDHAESLSAKLVNDFLDIFITDIDFKWTYVHTHEEHCGPYFAYPPQD